MDDQGTDRTSSKGVEAHQMFSDDNDFSSDTELADAGSRSLSLGITTACLLSLIATVVLVAVLVRMAANGPPEELANLVYVGFAGIVVIGMGMVITVRAM